MLASRSDGFSNDGGSLDLSVVPGERGEMSAADRASRCAANLRRAGVHQPRNSSDP